MGTAAVEWALRQEAEQPSAKSVLIVLAHRYNETTRICYPGIDRLASDTGYSAATVKRAIRALERQGLISVTHRQGDGSGRKTNLYSLPVYQSQAAKRDPDPKPMAQSEPLPVNGNGSDSVEQSITVVGQGVSVSPKQKANSKNEPKGGDASNYAPAEFNVTADMSSWAEENCPVVDIDQQTQLFKVRRFDHPVVDWVAQWKGWVLRAQGWAAKKSSDCPTREHVETDLPRLPGESNARYERRLRDHLIAQRYPDIAKALMVDGRDASVAVELPIENVR